MTDRLVRMFALIGPGILVAATGVGAGDLATGTLAGSNLGVVVLWAVIVGAALKFVLTEGLARWQMATGETFVEGATRRLGVALSYLFLLYLVFWSYFVGSALMSACGVAMHAMVPVFDDPSHGKVVFGVLHSAVGVALVLIGGFAVFERVMSVCIGVMFAVVVVTAALVCDDWGGVASGLVVPQIPDAGGEGVQWTVALLGGVGGTVTVLCYGYWIREKGREGAAHVRTCRIDLLVGYAMTAIFGLAMVVIGSTIEIEGKGAGLVVSLADRLEEPLGPVGRWVFLVGAWGAVFSSLLGVWQSVPFLFADLLRLIHVPDSDGVDERGRLYRTVLFLLATVPAVGLFTSFREVQKYYAIVGALFMPLLAAALLYLNGRRKWVGELRNGWLGVAMLVVTLATFLYFGWLEVERRIG